MKNKRLMLRWLTIIILISILLLYGIIARNKQSDAKAEENKAYFAQNDESSSQNSTDQDQNNEIDIYVDESSQNDSPDDAEEIIEKDTVEQVYERVKSIDFSVQEYPINTDVYDADMDEEYKNAFLQVLYSQKPMQKVGNREHQDYYFRETRPQLDTDNAEEYAAFLKDFFQYYYLDFDGDGLPELIVRSPFSQDPHFGGMRILKYSPEDKQVYILKQGGGAQWRPLCSGKAYHAYSSSAFYDRYGYGEIDQHGWVTKEVDFEMGLGDPKSYEISIYVYGEVNFKDVKIEEEMWNELIQDLLEVKDHAIQPMTYEEVFGDVTLVNG